MPRDLSTEELAKAAQACRAMAYQDKEAGGGDGEPHRARAD
jgi:hypothetical protein